MRQQVSICATVAALLGIAVTWLPARAACPLPVGDINGSGTTNVSDVQCGILSVLSALSAAPLPPCVASPGAPDVNCDAAVSIVDVQICITVVLGGGLSASTNTNGNGCPDACEDGCTGKADGAPCHGGDVPCTQALCLHDECILVPSADSECHDGNACTMDACVPEVGCQYFPLEAAACDDGNPCTIDACLPAVGCVHTASAGGGCNESCCEAHDDGGCALGDCTSCVCTLDSFCCSGDWDPFCVELSHAECASVCECGCGDGLCAAAETCESCEADCGNCGEPAAPSQCCSDAFGASCQLSGCKSCVCAIEPQCCSVGWNSQCAAIAKSTLCSASCANCGCGDGECGPLETCSSCSADCGACAPCGGTAEPGESCVPLACAACACSYSASCCGSFGGECLAVASLFCDAHCPNLCGDGTCDPDESCVGCPVDCGTCPNNCCAPHPLKGCNTLECQTCVCGIQPTCCSGSWTLSCASTAKTLCASSCDCAP